MVELKERLLLPEEIETEDPLREVAIRRLKEKRRFRGHLYVFLVVNAALWTIWVVDGALGDFGFPWPAFVTFFWGLLLLGEASSAYWRGPISEEEIQREVTRLKGSPRGLQGRR